MRISSQLIKHFVLQTVEKPLSLYMLVRIALRFLLCLPSTPASTNLKRHIAAKTLLPAFAPDIRVLPIHFDISARVSAYLNGFTSVQNSVQIYPNIKIRCPSRTADFFYSILSNRQKGMPTAEVTQTKNCLNGEQSAATRRPPYFKIGANLIRIFGIFVIVE